jgi:hypothetical protein
MLATSYGTVRPPCGPQRPRRYTSAGIAQHHGSVRNHRAACAKPSTACCNLVTPVGLWSGQSRLVFSGTARRRSATKRSARRALIEPDSPLALEDAATADPLMKTNTIGVSVWWHKGLCERCLRSHDLHRVPQRPRQVSCGSQWHPSDSASSAPGPDIHALA